MRMRWNARQKLLAVQGTTGSRLQRWTGKIAAANGPAATCRKTPGWPSRPTDWPGLAPSHAAGRRRSPRSDRASTNRRPTCAMYDGIVGRAEIVRHQMKSLTARAICLLVKQKRNVRPDRPRQHNSRFLPLLPSPP